MTFAHALEPQPNETWPVARQIFSGPMRPGHTPSTRGDANTFPGHEPRGRLFAIGPAAGQAGLGGR
jgi:D-mannonate dehydratase